MPNPFPGMNPFLERAGLWQTVHDALIAQIWSTLNQILPRKYVASIGERAYTAQHDFRSISPNVLVVRRHQPEPEGEGRTAVLVADPPPVLVAEPVEVREPFVEILSTKRSEQRCCFDGKRCQ